MVVAALATAPAATGAPTCSITWNGTVSNDWNTAGNWAPARVPTSTDVVCMAASPTRPAVALSSGATVRSVVFDLAASSLTLSSALTVTEPTGTANTSAVRNLTLNGGTWAGSAAITGLTSTTGTLSSGTVSLAGSSTVAAVSLTGAQVTNTGTLSWNSGTGYVEITSGSRFTNAAGATFTVTGNPNGNQLYGSGTNTGFVNDGSFVVNLGVNATPLEITVPFANRGAVTGTRGTARATGGGVSATPDTGSYQLTGGTVFAFAGGTRSVSTITSTGAGSIGIDGGSTAIAAGAVSNLLVTSGDVGSTAGNGFGVGALAMPSTGAGRIVGPGTVTITGTGTGAASTSVLGHLQLASGADLVNQASASWNASTNYAEFSGGSRFTNAPGATFTVTGNPNGYSVYNGGGSNAIVNAGNFVVALAAAGTPLTIDVPFANTGTVTGTSGTARATGGGVGGTPDTGSYQLTGGTVFAFAGGSRTVTTISGAGAGAVGIDGGTTTIAAGSVANLLLTAGSLASTAGNGFGIGALNAPATGSGTIAGPGTVTITGSGTGVASTSVFNHLSLGSGARLVNQGPATWNTGLNYLEFSGGSRLTNAGTFTVTGNPNGYSVYDGGGSNAIVNSGTFVTSLGATPLQINVPFANTGTVTGSSGVANANGGGVSGTPDTGSYQMGGGTVFAFAGGTRTVSTIDGTGAGSVGVSGGTTTIAAGSVANLLLTGGAVGAPSGGAFGIGALDAPASGSGSLTGPGTVTLTGTGSGAAATSVLDHLTLTSSAVVVNQAAATWNTTANYLEFYGGSRFTNAGTFRITGTANGYSVYDGGGQNALVNSGTTTVNLATAGATLAVGVPFTNTGTLTATRGAVTFTGGVTNLAAATLTGGTWNAPTGTITLPTPVGTNAAIVTIGATGQILAASTGTAAFAPLAVNSGSFTSGRSLTLTSSSLTNSGTLAVTGGILVVASLTQSAGTTTVAAGATLNAGTAAVRINGGTLTGSGTVRGAVSGGGTVAPGTSGAGNLTVTGTVNTTAGTTLAVTEGATAGTTVVASGAVNVGGAAVAITTTGAPAIGTVRTVISGSGRTGTVASVTGVDVPAAGGYWVVGYTPTAVTLTLTAYPAVSVTGGVVTEGDTGTTPATFTVTLANASPATAIVDYATVAGSATSGVDYAGQTGTLTFLPGETSKTVQVSVVGDTLHENDETFGLVLSNPRNTSLATASATATIDDDDAVPAFAVNDAQGATSAAGGGTVTFTVSLNTPSGLDASVQYATVNGTAVAGTDYTATSGTLTIPAGQTSATVDVQLATTSTYAPPKTFTLVLSDPVEASVADGSGTGTIVNGNPNGPTLAAVVPGQGAQGTAVPVTLNGTGFTAGSSVTVAGTGVSVGAVTVVDATTITTTFTLANTATVGARNVTVTSSGLSDTCSGCFTVVPRPTVTAVDRPNLATPSTDVVVTLIGSQFQPGADVKLVRPGKTVLATSTTTNSATSVTAFLTLPRGTTPGAWNAVVVNPDGGTGTCANCVTVWAAPTVTGVSPSTLARGTTTTVTISGTGFVAGAAVSIPGAQLSNVTVVNATTITATVRVPSTAATGARTVRVVNPASAGGGAGQKAAAVTVT